MALFGRSRTAPPAPRVEDFGFAELRGGGSRVVIVPALGGKIAQLELGGRQWPWASDVMPYAVPDENAPYAESGDTGGYDDCFPTVAPCKVPTWVKGLGGIELPVLVFEGQGVRCRGDFLRSHRRHRMPAEERLALLPGLPGVEPLFVIDASGRKCL